MNDKEILERVLSPKLQHLVFLLTSQKQPIYKSRCYYEKSILKASQFANATPCNLQQLADILMKPLILPLTDENGLLVKTPILLALSPHLRQNLILFLRVFKHNFIYGEFMDFLRLNSSKLEAWSKVILRSEEIRGREFEIENMIISKSSINKLVSLRSKFSSVSSFRLNEESGTETETETESENEELDIKSPPSKRRRLPSPPDNFFGEDDDIDENEMISACDKSVAEFKSKEPSEIIDSAPDEPLNEFPAGNQSKGKDEELISEFFVDNRSIIESCKTNFKEEKLSDIISLFTRCPLLDFRILLTIEFDTERWNVEFLLLVFERFVRKDCLSFEKMKSFVCVSITSRLEQCRDVIPRDLFDVISTVLKLSPRVGLTSVVCQMLCFEEFLPVHHELVAKLFASETLTVGNINKILEDFLSRTLPESWSEDLLGTLDFLVCRKANLADNCFALLISNLGVASKRFGKSLKLIKLVISLIQNYKQYVKIRFVNTLKDIVDQNETFLKKKALALL